jgi:hypothetical protein
MWQLPRTLIILSIFVASSIPARGHNFEKAALGWAVQPHLRERKDISPSESSS